jgi:ribonuclease P protein component
MQHLRAQADLARVRREGRSWAHRLLVLVAGRNKLDVTRVGIAAGKRVGSAVTRNRAKRLMREAVRTHSSHIAPGWDLLLIARAAITQVKMQDVAAALESLLYQAQILQE